MTIPTGANGAPVNMTAPEATFGVSAYGTPVAALSLALVSLTDDEAAMVTRLAAKVTSRRYSMELHNAYYEGTFRVPNLGVSIPPQMRNLRTALGWPRIAVDALDERLNLRGFRYPDSNDLDAGLMDIWRANDMVSESSMCHVDALVFGAGIVAIGTNADTPEVPILTVESPLDFAIDWDARRREMTAAFRLYGPEGARQGTLYLPDETIHLAQALGGWTVLERDVHRLGVVLIERIVNRARSYDRGGHSEITPELMSITDAACRTLLGLEVAREFYSAPQRYILGADESAFQDAQGNTKSGWETYMGRVLALERDPEGNVPTVGQFTPYDPSVFTKVIDMYAKIVSSITGLAPHVLGYTTDNPASADAIRSTEMRLKLKADRHTAVFGDRWAGGVMRKALMVRDGVDSDAARRIAAEWADTATPTPAATTDSIVKQIESGYLPATSDVVGEKLGYTPAERERIEADRITDGGASFLNELAHSMAAKDIKVGKSLAADGTSPAAPVPDAAGK